MSSVSGRGKSESLLLVSFWPDSPPPPHRRASDIKNLPSFNLRMEGVQVEVVEWVGEHDHFNELNEI
jgi:hypothetical protein